MKKTTSALLLALIISSLVLPSAALAAPETSAQSLVLMHMDTGQILYAKDADAQRLIASTTKIMTALVVLENCAPDETVEILPAYTGIEGSSMYLKAGERYTVLDLLYGMLLVSGNDAATALACHCAGSLEAFAELMNAKAAALGLTNTSFENPHGLDGKNQYSSAADLAEITREAMKNETFCEIVSSKTYTQGEQSYMNHNKLLWNYEGVVGVKTGYTMAAGRTLVSAAERDGLRLICVTLSDPDDWRDHKALYDWGFSSFAFQDILPLGTICTLPVISGEKQSVGITAGEPARLLVEKGEALGFSLELPEFVYAGVKAGDCAGRIFIQSGDRDIAEFPLYYSEDVPLAEGVRLKAWERLSRAWFLANKYGFVFQKGD